MSKRPIKAGVKLRPKRPPRKEPWVESTTLRALPYRPTGKLRATPEKPAHDAGWRSQEFVDENGELFERQRDGEWERWFRVLEKLGDHRKILYRHKPKPKPVEYLEARDRYEDLVFIEWAFRDWIEDAQELGIYGPRVLVGIRAKLDKLLGVLEELRGEIDLLRPLDLGTN